ncbi:MAG: lysophospholipase [Anaerolineales bacterium]|jgi:alpha-beta hydrolase superfamily lysophospholipase
MSHYEFERIAFDGLSLYFQGWQTEQTQKAIISLVHGLGEHSGRYTHWAALLNQVGYTVLTYDLRGHGKSGGNRGHISSFNEYLNDTDLLVKEAEDRFPGMPYFLYGHSLGAIITSNYVLRRKPKFAGVILTALSNKTALQEQKGKVMLAKVLGSLLPKMLMSTGLDPLTISKDPEVVALYKNDPMVHHQASLGFAKGSMDAIAWADQHASEWTLPVLFMHGEKDKLGYVEGSKEFASKIKGDCTLKIWPGLFHEVHNEPEKQQVFDYLREWLDKHSNAK